MSTALIDRTLSYLPLNENLINKEDVIKYVEGIFACGADYIEINSTILDLLKDTDLSERYIFRISSIADIKLCLDYNFAYVSLPLGLAPFFEKLSQRHSIIAEIYTGEYSVLSDLLSLKEHPKLTSISMVRLTGVVATTEKNTESLMKWYKGNFHIPLDICPLNTMLSGAGDAISFLKESCDAVSLSFGRNHYYTSMEDFLINRQILNRRAMPQETISAICSASLAFLRIFSSIPCGMERIAVKDSPVTAPVYDIEKGVIFRPFKPAQRNKYSKENILEKQIKTIGLEKEIEEAILDMLKKTNYSFYQNIIKRNIID